MKKRSAKNSEKRDQYTIVLEDIRDQFRAFGDNLQFARNDLTGIHKKLDSHSETLKSHTQILDGHTETLKSHTQILESHTQILESHTQMIGQLMIDMQEVKYELKKRPTFDDLKMIEKRVSRLEVKIGK